MGIGADERIGIGGELPELLPELDHRRQVFEVDLVDDAGAGRDHTEVVKRALRELEQLIALDVPLQLQLDVELERLFGPEVVHLHRMIDDEVAGDDGIDPVGIALHPGHRVPHRGEVHHAGHACKILEDDSRRHERDLASRAACPAPSGQVADVRLRYEAVARVTESVLEQHADGKGKPVEVGNALAGQLGEAKDDGLVVAEADGSAGTEWIAGIGGHGRLR